LVKTGEDGAVTADLERVGADAARPPGAERTRTAQRILDAAYELLGELGPDAVSAREVAERAGVNKALIFYWFGNKERLFERALERYYKAHRAALETAAEGGGTLTERLHRVIDAYVDFVAANHNYPRLVQRLVAGGDRHDFIQASLGPLLHWTEQALAGVAPETGPLAARHFFVTLSGAVVNYFTYGPVLAPSWRRDPLAPDAVEERRQHLHWLVDTLLAGLERVTRPGSIASSEAGPPARSSG